MRVLLATGNPHKLAEMRRILGELPGIEWEDSRSVPIPEPEETGATLEENAHLKAVHAARASGLAALAEDSGLEVAALNGAPGVRSARFAGHDKDYAANNRLLLEKLHGASDRRARFRAVVVVALPDGRTWQAEGELRGSICATPRGTGGFGYDPLFIPEGERHTLAELAPKDKDRISHRRRALEAIRPVLGSAMVGGGSR